MTVHAQMHDLAPREEVGVLAFSIGRSSPAGEHEIVPDRGPLRIEEVQRCTVIEPDAGNIDCGVVLKTSPVSEIMILAGSFPCSLAVRGIPELAYRFDPEYPLDRYQIVAFG